jgi:hypothetical protein
MLPTPIAMPEQGVRVAAAAPTPPASVHIALTACSLIMLAFCVIAAPRGAMSFGADKLETSALLLVPLLIPAILSHERKAWDRRDSLLMLPWTLLIALLVTQVAPTATTHPFPLRDELWRRIDEHLGIYVPAMMAFTARHPFLQRSLAYVYGWSLHPLALCAIFLPAIAGKKEAAQRFALSNAIGFVLALPCMLLLPAVGPWVGWHFAPTPLQQSCQASIESLRTGVIAGNDSFGGIICFPSFHVFWALVSAHALVPFRLLRYPAFVTAGLITVSTMTTGWHYGIDVIGGILLAVVSVLLAGWISSLGNGVGDLAELARGRRAS